jgi:two-component system, OmpR family, sensor histidine kinase VicK
MRLKLYPNINIRIVVPFLLVVAMVAALGVFITTRLVVGSIQERFTNQLADSATSTSNGFVELENQQLATLRLMAFTEGVPAAIAAQDLVDMEERLRPIAGNSIFEQVIVFNRYGQALLQLNRIPEERGINSTDMMSWPVVQDVVSGKTDARGDKFIDMIEQGNNTMLFMTAPITDKDGLLVGGVAGGITTRTLLNRLSQQSLSTIVLYGPAGQVWNSTLGVRDPALDLPLDRFNEFSRDVDKISPLQDLVIEGRDYQALYVPFQLRQTKIGLMAVALPSNFIVERSSTTRNTFFALFAALFVSVIVIGVAVSQTITRPVARLVETTRAIRSGDLSKRVKLRIPDELGELGISLDQMTEQLVQRNIEVNELYSEQLQETARRDAIISSISDALFVLDTTGRIVLQNPKAHDLLKGVAKDRSLHGKTMTLFKKIEELKVARTIDLGPRSYRVQTTQVTDQEGELLGHIMTFQDITILIETERAKDDLIKQMSHELRTPLTSIRGYVELVKILEPGLSQQGHDFIGTALNGLSVMERMVNEVIEVSVIVSNRFELDRRMFDLSPALNRLVEQWQPVCATRQLLLTLQMPPRLSLEADEERLMQVMDHLIRNAYSYSLPDATIQVQAQRQEDWILIQIIDQGVGIGEHEIERVFERLYRGASAEAGPTDARGLGLGLFISKTIVEAHNGSISLSSRLNKGTTVTVWLPVRVVHG